MLCLRIIQFTVIGIQMLICYGVCPPPINTEVKELIAQTTMDLKAAVAREMTHCARTGTNSSCDGVDILLANLTRQHTETLKLDVIDKLHHNCTDFSDCVSAPCLNGGICTGDTHGYNCTCVSSFVGDLCEKDISPFSISSAQTILLEHTNHQMFTDVDSVFSCYTSCLTVDHMVALMLVNDSCYCITDCLSSTAIMRDTTQDIYVRDGYSILDPVGDSEVKGFQGHCYVFYHFGLTWQGAKRYCESRGLNLLAVNSEEEDAWLETCRAYTDRRPVHQFSYIGGYAYTRTHSYRWVPSNEVVPLGQPFWAPGEPTHTSEQCMAYVLDAQGHLRGWVDIAGFQQLLFTCETP